MAILVPAFPFIVFRIAGFQTVGQDHVPAASDDIPNILNPERSSAVTLHLRGYGAVEFPQEAIPAVLTGLDDRGAEIVQISLSSDDILALCRRHSNYCSEHGSPIRRGNIRLVDGQVVIEGETFIDFLNRWQVVQLDLQLGEDATFQFESIVLEGVRYSIPANALGNHLRDLQATVNQALPGFSARSGGTTYALASIGISGDRLVVTFSRG